MPYKVKHTKVKKYKAFCFCVVIVQRTYVFIFGSHTKLYIFVTNIKLIEGETRKCIAFLPNIALGYYHQNLQCYRNAQRYLQQCPLTRFIILHTSNLTRCLWYILSQNSRWWKENELCLHCEVCMLWSMVGNSSELWHLRSNCCH